MIDKIKFLVKELEVASKKERITKLKSDLEKKEVEFKESSKHVRGLLTKEITILKVAIADLV